MVCLKYSCLMLLQRLSTDVKVLTHQLQHMYVLGEEHL